MTALEIQSIAQIVAGRGLNTLLEGLVLAGLSWGVLRVFGARSSMTRFAVWFSTLLVIAGMPLMSFSSTRSAHLHAPGLTLSGAWATGLFVTWAVIASVLLVRLGFSLWHVYRLRRECYEIDGASHPVLTEMAQEFSTGHSSHSRRVKFLVSDDVRVPTALGFFRPAVVLPTWTLRDLSAEELKGIVLHELAHLRRWDDWTNLAQKFLKALFFFHPAVWWIDSRLALEREIACDDLVLEQTANARTYAASLVSVAEKVVAEKMRMGRALALAQNALGRVREVSHRVAQILDTKRARSNRGWRPTMAIIGTLSIITLGGMPYVPELISFQEKVQPAFSGIAGGMGSVQVRPVSLHWTGDDGRLPMNVRREDARPTSGKSSAERISNNRRRVDHPIFTPAKTTLHKKSRTPKVVLAKAADSTPKVVTAMASEDATRQVRTLLVWHSSQFDSANSTVWTLTVWRIRSADGEQQTVQETIIMNSL